YLSTTSAGMTYATGFAANPTPAPTRSGYSRVSAHRRAHASRATGARMPDREALDDAGSVSAVAQRAAARVQPGDEPRPGYPLRRDHGPRSGAETVALRAGAARERACKPLRQVPPPRRGGAWPRSRGARGPRRAAAARHSDAGRAEGAERPDG